MNWLSNESFKIVEAEYIIGWITLSIVFLAVILWLGHSCVFEVGGRPKNSRNPNGSSSKSSGNCPVPEP